MADRPTRPVTFSASEISSLRSALKVPSDELPRDLAECASQVAAGYARPEDLRDLAAMSLVLARRLEARNVQQVAG